MKRSIRISAVLLFAMLFQSIALAMPCCFDMDRSSGEALGRMLMKAQAVHNPSKAAEASEHCAHHEQARQPAAAADHQSDETKMQCPMMGFLPSFQPASPLEGQTALNVPMRTVQQSIEPWMPMGDFHTRIERPPRSI